MPARRSILSDHARVNSSLRAADARGKRVATVHTPCSKCNTSRLLANTRFISVDPLLLIGLIRLTRIRRASRLLERDTPRDDRRAHTCRQLVTEERCVVPLTLERARFDAPIRARIEEA